MLKKLGKMLVVGVAAVSMMFVTVSMADAKKKDRTPGYYQKIKGERGAAVGTVKYFKRGHPKGPSEWVLVQEYRPGCGGTCEDAIALAESGIVIVNPHNVIDVKEMGWGSAGGKNLELSAMALATGKDQRFWFFKIPGFALSVTDADLMLRVFTKVRSTGVKLDGGLSATLVKSLGVLAFKASAIATGNDGCPQFAEVKLSGVMTTTAGGFALSFSDNDSMANTWGQGTTAVKLTAYDSDFDKHGWFILPPVAHAGIKGLVLVSQKAFFAAYTSDDGMTTRTFGLVTGGSALAFGDVDFIGIRAEGEVTQRSIAQDGMGAAAYGSSHAEFSGAEGYVYNGRCVSIANVGGLATVSGYNNIVHTGNSVSITSQHSAFATTGNSGFNPPQQVD